MQMFSGNRKLEEVSLPNIGYLSSNFLNSIFYGLKNTLTKLEFSSAVSLNWDFKALEYIEKLTDLTIKLHGVALNLTQVTNIGKIPNLKSFWPFCNNFAFELVYLPLTMCLCLHLCMMLNISLYFNCYACRTILYRIHNLFNGSIRYI